MPDKDSAIPTKWGGDSVRPPEEWPRVEGYQILGELGQGGMGVVYRAREISLGRVVALKVLHDDRQTSADAVRRFLREAEAATRVLHPHIVHIYQAGQAGEIYFLAMEYVDGVDLERLVAETGPLTVVQ